MDSNADSQEATIPMTRRTTPRVRRYENVSAGREENRMPEAEADRIESSTRTT